MRLDREDMSEKAPGIKWFMFYIRTTSAENCTFCLAKFTSEFVDLLDNCTLALDTAVTGRS